MGAATAAMRDEMRIRDTRYGIGEKRYGIWDERDGIGERVSYRNLEIWQMARELTIEVHRMTLQKLPKFEMFEEGSQIRRSMKSVKSNIVEGYGRRRYKQDFLKFLTYAHASCDETVDHLETLFDTESLSDELLYRSLHERLDVLGGKLNHFIQGVELKHNLVNEESVEYEVSK
jgi:four helix bundle protein